MLKGSLRPLLGSFLSIFLCCFLVQQGNATSCATWDDASKSLHIPCIDIEGSRFWGEMGFSFLANQILVDIGNFGLFTGERQCTDNDGDGYYRQPGCGTPKDCADNDAQTYPGAPELCDGLDNGCNDGVEWGCGAQPLSNPITIVGKLSIQESEILDVYILGEYAYITAISMDPRSKLYVISIRDPAYPQIVSALVLNAGITHFKGKYAYAYKGEELQPGSPSIVISPRNLTIIDLSSPENPTAVRTIQGSGTIMSTSGRYACGLFCDDECHVQISDISDPTWPMVIATIDIPHVNLSVISDKYVYLTTNYPDDKRLHVFDVRDPTNPVRVGSVDIPVSSERLYVSGNYAYISSAYNEGLQVVDIRDPANPIYLHAI